MVKKTPPASREADKFIVRLPDGLRGRIAVAAAENRRSMNAEVVAALEKAFPEIPGWPEFQDQIDFLLHAYKGGDTAWSRDELRQLIAVLVHQIGHGRPE